MNFSSMSSTDFLELRKHLAAEIKELKMVTRPVDVESNDELTIKDLEERVADLSSKLLTKGREFSVKELICERLHLSSILLDILFEKELTVENEEIIKKCLKTLSMISEISRLITEIKELSATSSKIKNENAVLTAENAQRMATIKSHNEDAKRLPEEITNCEDYKTAHCKVKMFTQSVDIIKNVFQQCTLTLNTPWTTYPELQKMLEESQEPFNLDL